MHIFAFRAALAAALMTGAGSGTAFAQAASGHWAWKTAPQAGPRAPFPAPKRIWVVDAVADRDCATMRAHEADCMKAAG